jgi:hypothetical protein
MSDSFKTAAIDSSNLITSFQTSILCSCSLCEHSLDIDGKVSMWAAMSSYNRKSKALRLAGENNGLILRLPEVRDVTNRMCLMLIK